MYQKFKIKHEKKLVKTWKKMKIVLEYFEDNKKKKRVSIKIFFKSKEKFEAKLQILSCFFLCGFCKFWFVGEMKSSFDVWKKICQDDADVFVMWWCLWWDGKLITHHTSVP